MVKKIGIRLLLLSILIFASTGCVKASINMEIGKDRSMNLSFIEAIDEEYYDSFASEFESESVKDLEDNGFFIQKYNVDGKKGFEYSKSISDINKISDEANISGVDAFNNLVEKDKQVFTYKKSFFKTKYIVNFDTSSYVNGITSEMTDESNGTITTDNSEFVKSQMDLDFTVKLPYKALSNNASSVSSDGKTLSWDLAKTNNIKFEFEIYDLTRIYIFIGLGVLLVIMFISSLIKSSSKKAKGDFKPTYNSNYENNAASINNSISAVNNNVNVETPTIDNSNSSVIDNTVVNNESVTEPVVENTKPVLFWDQSNPNETEYSNYDNPVDSSVLNQPSFIATQQSSNNNDNNEVISSIDNGSVNNDVNTDVDNNYTGNNNISADVATLLYANDAVDNSNPAISDFTSNNSVEPAINSVVETGVVDSSTQAVVSNSFIQSVPVENSNSFVSPVPGNDYNGFTSQNNNNVGEIGSVVTVPPVTENVVNSQIEIPSMVAVDNSVANQPIVNEVGVDSSASAISEQSISADVSNSQIEVPSMVAVGNSVATQPIVNEVGVDSSASVISEQSIGADVSNPQIEVPSMVTVDNSVANQPIVNDAVVVNETQVIPEQPVGEINNSLNMSNLEVNNSNVNTEVINNTSLVEQTVNNNTSIENNNVSIDYSYDDIMPQQTDS